LLLVIVDRNRNNRKSLAGHYSKLRYGYSVAKVTGQLILVRAQPDWKQVDKTFTKQFELYDECT
jgi:hypothetical protein